MDVVKSHLGRERDYCIVRMVSMLSESLQRALRSSRQRECVRRVICGRNNGAFPQLLSGHTTLMRAYRYRPGYCAWNHDESTVALERRMNILCSSA